MIERGKIEECIEKFLNSPEFSEIYDSISATVEKHSMLPKIKSGVLLGFSGGADSVMALLYLKKLSSYEDFKLACIHVNHGIRGVEADEDEEFSRIFCNALDVHFFCEKIDVPSYAKEKGVSLELAAREMRYGKFNECILKLNGVSTVVTAHNSTDNLETVIFNLSRGAGTLGISGISPIRGDIIRPLIGVSKEKITNALDKYNLPYVTDSTNNSDEYTRNYIRHEILPKLRSLNKSIEHTTLRLGENLRGDNDCLVGISRSFFDENYKNGAIKRSALVSLHKSIFMRVLGFMTSELTHVSGEKCHIDKIYSMLGGCGDFSIDIQAGLRFICRDNVCKIVKREACLEEMEKLKEIKLSLGENLLPEYDCIIYLSYNKCDKISSNVYNFSTQASIPNDIIIGDLRVRQKIDGDSYVFGGMTRKLKKLFCDKKIPKDKREKYPIICDDEGILFVPRFGVRDNSSEKDSKKLYVSIYDKYEE